MSAQSTTLEMELPADLPTPTLLARLGQNLMRTFRRAAWRVLDLETEFEPLD